MTDEYVLGHTTAELSRLDVQAASLAAPTRLAMQMAGLRPGMRVLDLGTGTGEVAFLAAEAVGPSGTVLGVDRSTAVLDYARAKCAERGISTVRFQEADVATFVPDEPFDACVGRLVLAYLPDPVRTVSRLLEALPAGGVYLALEYDTEAVRTAPRTPLAARLADLLNAAFAAAGTPQTLGPHLAGLLRRAGAVDATSIGFQTYLPPEDPGGAGMIVAVISSLLPTIAKHGIADVDALDMGTLHQRLTAEVREAGAAIVVPTLVAAWTHKA